MSIDHSSSQIDTGDLVTRHSHAELPGRLQTSPDLCRSPAIGIEGSPLALVVSQRFPSQKTDTLW